VPCATTWVGLATTYTPGSFEEEKEAALAQALQHDAHNVAAWAQLALSAFARGAVEEAVVHVSHALDLGLDDQALLKPLAAACAAAGMQEAEQACRVRADDDMLAWASARHAGSPASDPASPGCGTPLQAELDDHVDSLPASAALLAHQLPMLTTVS
jgi:hypothetical protein